MSTAPQVKEGPAPPVAIVDALSMQLEGALATMHPPAYVAEAAQAFVAAMKKWSNGNA